MTTEKNGFDAANSELQQLLSREKGERDRVERDNEHLRVDIDKLRRRVDAAESFSPLG